MTWLVDAETKYAEGYSEAAFARIELGMTLAEVHAVAGPPLEQYSIRHTPSVIGWRYTRPARDGSYHVRALNFEGGRVSYIAHKIHVD